MTNDPTTIGLRGHALAGALALIAQYPFLRFTRGKSDRAGQAHAMAVNTAEDPRFVQNTYVDSPAKHELVSWVQLHPNFARSVELCATAFLSILNKYDDAALHHVSRHLSGDAWDVEPREDHPQAAEIKAFIRALPGCDKFLEKESGLTRWHAQFS